VQVNGVLHLVRLIVGLAIVAVLTTLGTERTLDRVFGDPTLTGDPEDLRVYPTGEGSDASPAVLDDEPGVALWFGHRRLFLGWPHASSAVSATVPEGVEGL
jgi:hypothetical protein